LEPVSRDFFFRIVSIDQGNDVDELAPGSAVTELHHTGDLGIEGIVLAAADVQPRLEPECSHR
jgi:hypothetical protein